MADRGRIIDGKYELVEKVGEGGMAVVWRAYMHGAAGFKREVAVKKIKREFRAIKNYINMFVEEARVGSELAHPNIVQVHDFCADEEGSYYLVMEWVEGMDMAALIRSFLGRSEMPPWELVVAIGIGALRGLAAAHERRRVDGTFAPVIHRDVSPHNILLAANGIVKLTDFGLARARDRMFSLTAPGTVKGKLSYLAPEITAGESASPHSDLFSMGTVLWESLVGQRLFAGNGDLEVFKKIRACQVRPLADHRAGLPVPLMSAVHRALQKNPMDRFPSARAMATELADVLKTGGGGDAHKALGQAVQRAREDAGLGPVHPGSNELEVNKLHSVEIEFSSLDAGVPADKNTDNIATSVDVEFSDVDVDD
jgi:serine/threonine-protein kinase